MVSGFGALSRDQPAALVPELLLCGHLIDRAGMPHLLGAFGLEGMRDVAIEEWKGASPTTPSGCKEYVEAMCHAIEDPTMDATALATDLRARMNVRFSNGAASTSRSARVCR